MPPPPLTPRATNLLSDPDRCSLPPTDDPVHDYDDKAREAWRRQGVEFSSWCRDVEFVMQAGRDQWYTIRIGRRDETKYLIHFVNNAEGQTLKVELTPIK